MQNIYKKIYYMFLFVLIKILILIDRIMDNQNID